MTSEEMLREIAALPTGARREIEDYVARLAKRYRESKKSSVLGDLASEPFIGMWSDRDDMTDSTAWVRAIRETHWRN